MRKQTEQASIKPRPNQKCEQAQLRTHIAEYTETYGETPIRHGEAEFALEALERLAGWEV